jgi:chromosome segregation ATPase
MQFKADGTIATHTSDNKASRTTMGQGSGEMAQGGRSLGDLEAERDALLQELDNLNAADRVHQNELAELNDRVRISRGRLSTKEYADVCARQNDLKQRITANAARRSEVRRQVRAIEDLKAELKTDAGGGGVSYGNALQLAILNELRAIRACLEAKEPAAVDGEE